MKASIRLGRWLGIPVGLHYSWFVIAWLIAVSVASQFAATNPGWSPATVWTLSIITAALFFLSIVLHELGHAVVARWSGVPVRGITLFALGGIAQIEKDAETAGREFRMAIAGPIVSVAIGLVCRLIASALDGAPAPSAVFFWLGDINIVLALFNLIPGFPLDGGRVLRSIVWAITHSAERATRVAARVGQAIAFVFIGVGLFWAFTRGDFGGLWIAIIGWFLLEGARATYGQARLSTALEGVRVADVMARDCGTVGAATTLQQFVDDQLVRFPARCFTVRRDDQVIGLISPADVKRIERAQWHRTSVSEAMHPLESLHAVKPDAPAADALAMMARDNVAEVPVMSSGRLVGVVLRSYLLHLLRVREELRT